MTWSDFVYRRHAARLNEHRLVELCLLSGWSRISQRNKCDKLEFESQKWTAHKLGADPLSGETLTEHYPIQRTTTQTGNKPKQRTARRLGTNSPSVKTLTLYDLNRSQLAQLV
jgi:hypothetical protein